MHDGITQAHANEILLQGVTRMQLLMLNTMFLGGLKEDIRNRVLEEGPTHPDNSVKLAREIKSIINDRRNNSRFTSLKISIHNDTIRSKMYFPNDNSQYIVP